MIRYALQQKEIASQDEKLRCILQKTPRSSNFNLKIKQGKSS